MGLLTADDPIAAMSALIDGWRAEGERKYAEKLSREAEGEPDTPEEDTAPEHEVLSWDKYRGQENLKAHMRIRAESARLRGDAIPPTLLVAPPGAGKTTLAKLVAHEMGRRLLTVTSPCTAADLIPALRRLGPGGILFVDEVHLWSQKQQHDLMQLTETGMLDGPRFAERFEALTVITATTDPQLLVGPLQSRMMIRPNWEPYTDRDMAAIIGDMADNMGVADVFTGIAERLVTACAGSPRQARMLVTAGRDLAWGGVEDVTAGLVLEFAGLEPDGLTRDHLAYLTCLAGQKKSMAGQNALAAILNMPPGQIKQLERLLLDRGLIALTGQGRQLTSEGLSRSTV